MFLKDSSYFGILWGMEFYGVLRNASVAYLRAVLLRNVVRLLLLMGEVNRSLIAILRSGG